MTFYNKNIINFKIINSDCNICFQDLNVKFGKLSAMLIAVDNVEVYSVSPFPTKKVTVLQLFGNARHRTEHCSIVLPAKVNGGAD